MTNPSRSAERARRLSSEASNCISIAIGAQSAFAAELIDEAARLRARSRELVGNDSARTAALDAA